MNPPDEAARLYRLATEAAMHWTGLLDQLPDLEIYVVDDLVSDAVRVMKDIDQIRYALAALACAPATPARPVVHPPEREGA